MELEIICQLLLATFLGALVGLEREYKKREAGLRTYALVCLGASLYTIISFGSFDSFPIKMGLGFDPGRIIGQIVVGIGFIGAGLIIYRQFHIEGITTAAGLWVVAAIGAAVGAKLYFMAVFVALIAVGILAGLRLVEEKIFGKRDKESQEK